MLDEYYLENPSENDYLYEMMFLQAERDHEEWMFWKQDQLFEKEQKAATITVKKEKNDKIRTKPTPVSRAS